MSNQFKNMKKILIRLLVIVMLLPMVPILPSGKAEAASSSSSFTISGESEVQTKSIPLPVGFKSVQSISVNNGSVAYQVNGANLDITLTGGSKDYVGKDYGPPSSRIYTTSFYCTGTCYGISEFPNTNDRSITLVDAKTRWRVNGADYGWTTTWQQYERENHNGSSSPFFGFSTSGNVGDSVEVQYRTYTGYRIVYNYTYNVTVNFTTNEAPLLNVTNSGDISLYNDGGTFSISGTVSDADNDGVTVSAIVGGVTKSVSISNTSTRQPWTLSWSGTELPVGIYMNPTVTVTDGTTAVGSNYYGKVTILAQIYYYWSKFTTKNESGWYKDDNPQNLKEVFVKHVSSAYQEENGGTRFYEYVNKYVNSSSWSNYWYVSNTSGDNISFANNVNGGVQNYKYSGLNGIVFEGLYYKYLRSEYMLYQGKGRVFIHEVAVNPPKEKGTLIQSNIKAVQNTYPDNGIHSDGFWYVKSGLVPNNLPLISIGQDGNKSINLKSGSDTFTISGTVSDPDNESLSVSATIDGVMKKVAVSNTATPKSFSLTWRTSEFATSGDHSNMVLTVDDGRGGVATGTYTGKLTVDKKALYYWDKYNAVTTKVVVDWDKVRIISNQVYVGKGSYYIDNSGTVSVAGTQAQSNSGTVYTVDSSNVLRSYFNNDIYLHIGTANIGNGPIVKGSTLLEKNILDIDGTYPDNGLHSDGNWYVKKATTNMSPVLIFNGSGITVNQVSPDLKITGTLTDADGDNVTIKATVNGIEKTKTVTGTSSIQTWELVWTSSELPEGTYTNILISANDPNGGTDTVVYNGIIIVDRNAPTSPVVTARTIDWTDQDVAVTITPGTDASSGIAMTEYKINNGSWQTYSNVITISTEGETTVTAKSTDYAGNVSTESSVVTKIVKTPPTAPTLTPSVGGWTKDPVNITINGSKGYGDFTYQYKVGNGSFQTGDTLQVTEEGSTIVTARAINAFGNVSAESYLTVTIDKTLPVITVTPNGRTWGTTEVEVIIKAEDTLSGLNNNLVSYYVSKTPTIPTTWSTFTDADKTIKITDEGQWYVIVQTTDKAMNTNVFISDPYQIQSEPTKPTNLKASNIQSNEVTVSWDSPSGNAYTDGYTYELNNLTTGSTQTVAYPISQIVDSSVLGGTLNEYQVIVKNHVGQEISDTFSVLTKPDVPEGLAITKHGTDFATVTISTYTVTGADQYKFIIKDAFGSVIDTSIEPTNSYTLSNLNAETIYNITASALNATGEGNSKSISYLSLPDAPNGFQTILITPDTIELTWMQTWSAIQYNLWRDNLSVYAGVDKQFMDMGLLAGTSYDYKLSIENSTGEGAYTELNGVMTLPDKVLGLKPIMVTPDSATLSWDEVKGANSFFLSNSDGQTSTVTGSTYETTFSNLLAGTEYTVAAEARNTSGSGQSSAVSFYTVPDAVYGVVVEDVEVTSATLKWSDQLGATKYRITLDGNVYEVTDTMFQPNTLDGSKNYNYTIEAGNVSGYSTPVSGSFLTKPHYVSNIKVAQLTSSQIDFTWDKDDTAIGYTGMLTEVGLNQSVLQPGMIFTNLESGKSYEFVISATNASGDSLPTSIRVTTKTLPVSDFKIDVEKDKVTITFPPVDNAKDYVLLDEKGTEIWRGQDGPIVISPITDGKEYDYKIVVENDQGVQSEPTPIQFITIPATPEGIAVGKVTTNSVEFDLSNAVLNGASEVIIYRNEKEIGKIPSSQMTYTDRPLVPNTEYTYEFKASNESGISSEAFKLDVTTNAIPVVEDASGSGSNGASNGKDTNNVLPPKVVDPIDESTQSKKEFNDIKNNFAESQIIALANLGIIKGTSDTSFEPSRPITRMEYASMLVRAMGLGVIDGKDITFNDLNTKAWYMSEIQIVIDNGVAKGFSSTEFRPDSLVNREQASKMLGNILKATSEDDTKVTFIDKKAISEWAKNEVIGLTERSLVEGYPDGTFRPKANLTRAESAMLIFRTLDQLK